VIKVEGKIEGVEELLKAMEEQALNMKKTTKGAVRAGARVIGAAAKANANAISSQPGNKVSVRVRQREGFAVASIFPAKGHSELRVIELGSKEGWRWARKKGPFVFWAGNRLVVTRLIKHPGTVAKPWLRPAFDSAKDAATQAVAESLRETIEAAKVAAEGSDE
jgi:HK97 gp10 family phage protein